MAVCVCVGGCPFLLRDVAAMWFADKAGSSFLLCGVWRGACHAFASIKLTVRAKRAVKHSVVYKGTAPSLSPGYVVV